MKSYIGRIEKYNPEKQEITFKLLFVDETTVFELFDLQGGNCKIILKGLKRKELQNSTRRRWFQVLSFILKENDIPVTKENLQSFHTQMKESYFDVKTLRLGHDDKAIVLVPSINSIPDQEVKIAIEKIIERYSQLGIDFSKMEK